ncbi:MAG: NAD(P)-dependent oxidoreductase, partial [Parachlamydiaceae bacterium]
MKKILNKEKVKILLLEGIHPSGVDKLEEAGFKNIERLEGALQDEALIQKLAQVDLVGIRSNTHLTSKVLKACPQLTAIGCFCIGVNQVDLNAATHLGIPVFNDPYSNTRSVAEMVLALAIILMRDLFSKSIAAHKGEWRKVTEGAHEVRGKTIGIVGYGHVGSQVSSLAEALGMSVIYYDIEMKLPLGNAKSVSS